MSKGGKADANKGEIKEEANGSDMEVCENDTRESSRCALTPRNRFNR